MRDLGLLLERGVKNEGIFGTLIGVHEYGKNHRLSLQNVNTVRQWLPVPILHQMFFFINCPICSKIHEHIIYIYIILCKGGGVGSCVYG